MVTVRHGKAKSKGKECKGVYRTSVACNLSRVRPGKPIVMSRACSKCGEWRCRSHCRCKRIGELTGRSMARGFGVKAARSTTPSSPSLSVAAPVGRPAALDAKLLDTETWYDQMIADISKGSEVELATYMYDNQRVHECLLARLRSRRSRPFVANIYLDDKMQTSSFETPPKQQRSRVRELKSKGAKVYLCKGKGGLGAFHCKGVVVDRRVLYTGSPNITTKSAANEEWGFRLVGPIVQQALDRIALYKVKFAEL